MNVIKIDNDMCKTEKDSLFRLIKIENKFGKKIKLIFCSRTGIRRNSGNVMYFREEVSNEINNRIDDENKNKIITYEGVSRKLNIERKNKNGKLRVIN